LANKHSKNGRSQTTYSQYCCSQEMLEVDNKWRICEICKTVIHRKRKHNGSLNEIIHLPGSKVALRIEKRMMIKISAPLKALAQS